MKKNNYCFETLDFRTNQIYKLANQLSESESTVLVLGESGTGKEAICHLLHAKGKGAEKPFVPVNCPAIPDSLIEVELFGHEEGAFTGARTSNRGKFEQAEGGMIVLDEISEINLRAQAKLLRVIEAKEFFRIGGKTPIKLDVRIVATSSQNLKEMARSGRFREDLYYRLDVMRVELPSLKERSKDIPLLAEFFLNELAGENNRQVVFSPEIYHFLCKRAWEGNIRELKNYVTRLYFLASSETLTIHDLYHELSDYHPENPNFIISAGNLSLNEIEKKYILHTMHLAQGNKSKAARALKISLKTLRSKLKEYEYKEPQHPEMNPLAPLLAGRRQELTRKDTGE